MSLENRDVLIVEDNALERAQSRSFLEGEGAFVSAAENLRSARKFLTEQTYDLVLLDMNLPDGEGLSLLKEGCIPETTAVIVATGEEDLTLAVEAMRLGALDYLVKPYAREELPLLFARGRQVQKSNRLQRHESGRARDRTSSFYFGKHLEGMRRKLEMVLRKEEHLRDRLPPILIEGETGTGKTLLARYIHDHSARASGPFIDLNCSNLNPQLAESELFGHERGAFTDARTASVGLFEAADGGTLFLDEIANLAEPVQAKLLKAIEEQSIRRVGGRNAIQVNIRLIGASIEPLDQLVRQGRFREDLFQRLNLIRIGLPPLRERVEDLPEIARMLLERVARRYHQKVPNLSAEALQQLKRHRWPGNVRELEHEIERALIFGEEDEFQFTLLPGAWATPNAPNSESPENPLAPSRPSAEPDRQTPWLHPEWEFPREGLSLDEVTRTFVQLALAKTGQNLSQSARLLKIPRHVLRYMLEGKNR